MFWFIVALVFFVLWLTKGSSGNTAASESYNQGYWDGYRALGSKIRALLGSTDDVDAAAIEREVSVGFTGVIPSDESVQRINSHEASSVTTTSVVAERLSPESAAEIKEAQSIKNLNTLLFVGSLLLVAAGATFVAAAMPKAVKLIGLWAVVAAFYGVGIKLHYYTKFRAAGVAFIGTSLGLIPFAGVALYQLTDMSAAVAWTITSLIGVGAYFWATVRLESQVVAYLTMAFVVSLAASLGETVGLPLMWSFVLVIGTSLLASIVSIARPTWVPEVFSKSIEHTGQLVTPLALVTSLMLADKMSIFAYEVVFGVATLHYFVAWLQSRRFVYETVTRILLHVTLLIVAGDLLDDRLLFGIVFLALASLQQLYSLSVRLDAARDSTHTHAEQVWVFIMQFLQLVSCVFWLATPYDALLSVASVAMIGLSSMAATFRFMSIQMAVSGLAASVLLPIMVARWLLDPVLDWGVVTAWFVVVTAAIIATYATILRQRSEAVRQFFQASFATYAAVASVIALFVDELWSGLLFMALAGCVWAASYVVSRTWVTVAGNAMFAIAIVQLLRLTDLELQWFLLVAAWMVGIVFYFGHHLLLQQKDNDRAMGLLGSMWVMMLPAVLVMFSETSDVANIAAAGTIILGAASVAAEGRRRRSRDLVEVAVYIGNIAVLRMIGILFLELNVVFYAHWSAAVVAIMALWRQDTTHRLMMAMGFVTASTGILALSEGGWYQLLFLVEHLALLVTGALMARRWAMWWGLVASCLAILYFLKGVAFLAFGFLGLVIIGVVVWRLAGVNPKS